MATTTSPGDELLSILLVNLRNAAATFGEGTPPHESIRTTIEDHVRGLKQSQPRMSITGVAQSSAHAVEPAMVFANLAHRPKPAR
ncbi:hypothetical protein LTR62_003932 [Meristemomyces frigidus]|uniref:Uncharacterized protein n=1 Tax=Meristemomyces frigidus TaxID=1508187 RepID=A0AAN7TFT1_9PEZI|nr:hypothetical protein LTR62_003932 [Meristemomyces frigidus]